jgi:hypothetical protein
MLKSGVGRCEERENDNDRRERKRGTEFCGCDWFHPKHDLMALING